MGMGRKMVNGLGDIQPKFMDPLEHYFDIVRQGVKLPRHPFIVSPDWMPCEVSTGDPASDKLIKALQQAFECHVLPRVWQTLMDFWQKSQCGTYFIKSPNWVEPPITAVCIDEESVPGGVSLVRGAPAVVIASASMPDRFVGTMRKLALATTTFPGAANVRFTVAVNKNPIHCFNERTGLIGTMEHPETLSNPVPLKHEDILEVLADLPAGPATETVFARVEGYKWPAREISQAGDYTQYHTV
jgi:hypothetical protein